ncbi:MAG: type I methionyl aminopeptidase [Patescibacteria group bacterium]
MIPIKSEKEIEIMAENGKILSSILKEIREKAVMGIETQELNKIAEVLISQYGTPSFKGYDNFPAGLCVSINEEIVHGTPSKRKLKEGDIVSLDIGLYRNEFHVDMATTFAIGSIPPEAQKLIQVGKKSLKRGIKKIKVGNTFGDIGNTIQRYVEDQGFAVVRDLCGHGIGRNLHEDPQILNYGKRHKGMEIQEGMVFCLEPMVTAGSYEIELTKDGSGYKTIDNSLSVHFEHTIAVTKNGVKILTE